MCGAHLQNLGTVAWFSYPLRVWKLSPQDYQMLVSYKASKNKDVDTGDEAIYGMCAVLIFRICGQ